MPGASPVPVSGKVVGFPELANLFDAALDLWLTEGRFADELEQRLAATVGVRHAYLCNSGSSANLLAVSTLASPSMGDRRLRPGDEVITVAASFPTTVNPIVLNGLVPVFVDVELGTYNARVDRLAEAIGPRTRAIALAHTLGNPVNLGAITELAVEHDLFVVEDTCDALGARYDGRAVGTFGDLATQNVGGAKYRPKNLYAATKQAFEDVLAYSTRAGGLFAVTLNIFDTYGPQDRRGKLLSALIDALITGDALAMGSG